MEKVERNSEKLRIRRIQNSVSSGQNSDHQLSFLPLQIREKRPKSQKSEQAQKQNKDVMVGEGGHKAKNVKFRWEKNVRGKKVKRIKSVSRDDCGPNGCGRDIQFWPSFWPQRNSISIQRFVCLPSLPVVTCRVRPH